MKHFCVAAILILSVSIAESVDSQLVGKWLATMGKDGHSANALLEINASGEYNITLAPEERGTLTTNPESWNVSSASNPYVAHGKYQINNPDSFSAVFAGTPYEWIVFTRIPEGQTPRIDASLLPKDLLTAETGSPGEEFNPALIGLWQASKTAENKTAETVWRIQPNGKSIRIYTVIDKGKIETSRGNLKLSSPLQNDTEGTYVVHDRDAFEWTDADGTTKWGRVK